MSEKLTRQQIYDKIRATSKDSYILEEMQRLGFWESSDAPSLSEVLIRREAEIGKELNSLMEQNRKYNSQEAMLTEMRKERMKKAREKRAQTKLRNKQKRQEKAERWEQLQSQQIIYLGEDVSAGLSQTDNSAELLQKYKLPVYADITELAVAMNTDLASLRYLVYNRNVSRTTHYHTFGIPKKSGGIRKISAPKTKLKQLQAWVLENILNLIPACDTTHGFTRNRSIVTNALPHVGNDIVINVDLKDFFPTISYKRVKGLFRKLGYSEQLSIVFALVCTQPETETVLMDGVTYYVQKENRYLPQGSPASPAISNLIAYRLDRKITGLARKLGFTYTRYADDLSFSATKEQEQNISKLLNYLKKIIQDEGFTIHPDKTHIMRKGGQQKVTGIVVNEKPNIERRQLRRFRALLHDIGMNGWKDQQWGRAKHLINSVEGYIHYVHMVNPAKGDKLRQQLKDIISKHGYPVAEKAPVQPEAVAEPIAQPDIRPEKTVRPENNDWWNILS